ncbi:pyrroloquinoline quinone biosynthesis protein PqqB [Candidatus Marinimicrobia bacterium PRS2]|nr:pyrroloquinoline quinone biosynthesis protein PqqB [Candidatus Marinimicrobia bacterium PRS2]
MQQANASENLLVLGTAQDGGYPHAGCSEDCCREAWKDSNQKRLIASLAVLDGKDCFLVDITPDFKYQLQLIEHHINEKPRISGICITHAHLGHYMGLLDLGLEVMNTNEIPVYVMPKMKSFLENNAPFTQLLELNNIHLFALQENYPIDIFKDVKIIPFQVPHRNEYSETVGYRIQTSRHSVLYIPDIDSWDGWDTDINEMIKESDIALLDGTFYDKTELKNRDVSAVPHPSIRESIIFFSALDKMDRKKVNFTHLNHTNNVLREGSKERKDVIQQGFQIAYDGMAITI